MDGNLPEADSVVSSKSKNWFLGGKKKFVCNVKDTMIIVYM